MRTPGMKDRPPADYILNKKNKQKNYTFPIVASVCIGFVLYKVVKKLF